MHLHLYTVYTYIDQDH